jgi:hypothetical protein
VLLKQAGVDLPVITVHRILLRFLNGSLGARDCGLSEVGFLLSHEPQLATPTNLAQEIRTHNERREQ